MAAQSYMSYQHSCSFDNLIGASKERGWDCQTKNPRSLVIDYKLEFVGLYNRQVGWLCAF